MPDIDAIARQPSRRSSTRKRTSQNGSRPHADSVISENTTPPASPRSTAEYWDRCVEKLEEERRLRKAAASNSFSGQPVSPRQGNRMVLDIISSYSDFDSPCSPSSPSPTTKPSAKTPFDFGFPERDRADSAHDIAESLDLIPRPLANVRSNASLDAHSSPSLRVRGLRKEGQTLASPVPAKPSQPQPAGPNAADASRKPRKCPPRPPRPDEPFSLGLPLTPSPHANRVARKPIALQERRTAPPTNIHIVRADHTPPMSSKSTPALPNLAPQPPAQYTEPTPPTTPIRNASFALQQQTISVWEDDDDEEDEKTGLMEYVRRTIHASKNSFSGDRDKERESKEKEREKERESPDEQDADNQTPGGRRRRDTVRQAVIRVFRCGNGAGDER